MAKKRRYAGLIRRGLGGHKADRQLTRESNIQNFQFKVTHHILASGYNLAIWKVIKQCMQNIDTIEYFLVEYENTAIFWNRFKLVTNQYENICF